MNVDQTTKAVMQAAAMIATAQSFIARKSS